MSSSPSEQPKLMQVPTALIARLTQQGNRCKRPQSFSANNIYPEGQRNTTLFIKAVQLFGKGFSLEAAARAIREENKKRARPKLPVKEVEQIGRNAQKFVASGQDEKAFKDPHYISAELTSSVLCHEECSTVRFYRTSWWIWVDQAWRRCPDDEFRAIINRLVRELH